MIICGTGYCLENKKEEIKTHPNTTFYLIFIGRSKKWSEAKSLGTSQTSWSFEIFAYILQKLRQTLAYFAYFAWQNSFLLCVSLAIIFNDFWTGFLYHDKTLNVPTTF